MVSAVFHSPLESFESVMPANTSTTAAAPVAAAVVATIQGGEQSIGFN